MKIQLSDHFTYSKLLRFTLPSIVMMVFTSVYGIVDGIFVSNFVGSTSFAAVNLIFPYLNIFYAIGFIFGTGGSALVAKILGEGNQPKAQRIFSLLVYLTIGLGLVFTVIGELLLEPVAVFLQAEGELFDACVLYGRICLIGSVAMTLQNVFQSFMVTAERPHFGLAVTVAAGVTNMLLDAVLVGLLRLGVAGAALATVASQLVGGLIPLVYFFLPNKSNLHLRKPEWNPRAVVKTCTNGASEFVVNISMSLVNMLYNYQLMKLIGEDGVTAYGIIMYAGFIFMAIGFGYSMGSAPIVSFHYGAQNHEELKNLFRKSLTILGVLSVVMFGLAEVFGRAVAGIFVGYDSSLWDLSTRAMRLYSISYLLSGFNVYASSFFTALNNGKVSALISFARTLLFQIVAVLVLPLLLQVDGIWLAMPASEVCSILVTGFCFLRYRKKYQYA